MISQFTLRPHSTVVVIAQLRPTICLSYNHRYTLANTLTIVNRWCLFHQHETDFRFGTSHSVVLACATLMKCYLSEIPHKIMPIMPQAQLSPLHKWRKWATMVRLNHPDFQNLHHSISHLTKVGLRLWYFVSWLLALVQWTCLTGQIGEESGHQQNCQVNNWGPERCIW